jgi:hypothetical protein
MKGTRFPTHPGKVLTRSIQLGLAVTSYLAKSRTTRATKHLYEGGKGCKGIRRIYEEANENYLNSKRARRPNAVHFQRAENNIRRSFNKIIFNTSVPYGNTETTRKRRREDRKYINNLADYYGARLRDLGAERFPFPPPMRSFTDQGKVKWVYPGNSRIPEFTPRHTAPEQDFIDIIRSHGIELIRQCMKYSVPLNEARRHLDALIKRLTPYLEYVYTEQKKVESGFVRGSAKILREITLEIRASFGGVNGRQQSITGEVSESLKDEQTEFILIQNSNDKDLREISKPIIIEKEFVDVNSQSQSRTTWYSFLPDLAYRCDTRTNPEWKKQVKQLRTLIEGKLLGPDDSKHIAMDLREYSRKLGSAFHDFITNAEFATRPFNLQSVFMHGDEMVSEKTEFLFSCEVPIANGRGRLDILLSRRKKLQRVDDSRTEYIWEPCMLIEVKSKCFYNLDLYATLTKSKNRNSRVVEHVKELRSSEDPEWEEIIESRPTKYECLQLDTYEKIVLEEYQRYTRQDSDPPKNLMKGVLVVDLNENWVTLRDHIKELILKAYHASKGATLSKREHFHLSPEYKTLRMGLVIFNDVERRETNLIKIVQHFDPFHYSKKREDDREIILYLTVSGKGSPAESAARIATKWHGLELIYKQTRGKHRDIFWFDLTGEYATPEKRGLVIRIDLQPESIKGFLQRKIRFVDLSESISSYLQGNTSLSKICTGIRSLLINARRPFIVVTGIDRVRSTIPKDRKSLLDELMIRLLNEIPGHSTALWFDRPVPISKTSQRYDTRSIAPFYSESHLVNLVDEIIYNVPSAPMRYGSYVPVQDDIRWLIDERADAIDITPVLIPPLYLWGERFRPDSERVENISRQQTFYLRSSYQSAKRVQSRTFEEDDEQAILELIPHLQRFYEENSYPSGKESIESVISELLLTVPSAQPSFLSRVNFTPHQYLITNDHDGRVTRLEPLGKINQKREYRDTRLYGQPRRVTTRPPHVALLKYRMRDHATIVSRELSGIRRIIKILRKSDCEMSEWKGFLNSIYEIVDRNNINRASSIDVLSPLRAVRMFLETHPLSKEIWVHLKEYRTRVPQGLSTEQEVALKQLISQHPDQLLFIGNQLFLILLAALHATHSLECPRTVTQKLWEYLIPWQLMALGFEPEYPPHHQTGESVLHRPQLIDRLARHSEALIGQCKNEDVCEIQFGKAAFVEADGRPTSILLLFQARPDSHDLNAISIRLSSEKKDSIVETLRGMCREKPFWGESDLTHLGILPDTVSLDESMDIMVATYRGVRGLWIHDRAKNIWILIGRLDYYTRKREGVTLLMSMTLRKDADLEDIIAHKVRAPPSDLRDIVEVGLGTVSAVFRRCEVARCQVSIDTKEQMFRVSFLRPAKSEEIANLLIKRTVDVLEILRRPDFQCEQVVIGGHELIWNRFKDIEYMGDASILRPWVERREPFKTADLSLPATAELFIGIKKKVGLELSVLHDHGTCPLCLVSEDELKRRMDEQSGVDVSEYLQRIEGQLGQPDEVLSESVFRHGVCWRVMLKADEDLPEGVKHLERVALSGPTLATLLKTGALVYKDEDEWVIHEFEVPQVDSLPREFRESVFLVEAYREIVPKALKELHLPGSYLLKREERWVVSLNFQQDEVVWSARSDTTGETYYGQSFTVLVYSGESLERATDRVINSIVKTLPLKSIRNFQALQEHVKGMLRSMGFQSENLYTVELDVDGDLVKYYVEKKDPDSTWHDYGSIKISKGMTSEEVFELLKESLDRKVMSEEYEIESPDEVRESLSDIFRGIPKDKGWSAVEETSAGPPLDPLAAAVEYGRMRREAQELRTRGMSQQALEVIDTYIKMIEPEAQRSASFRSNLLEALILKVEVLVCGEIKGTIGPRVLVSLLDRVELHSHHLETRILASKSEFGKRVRWALSLRESLKGKMS